MEYSDANTKIEINSPIAKTIPWNMKSSSLSFLISGTNEIFDFSSVLISVFLGRVWSPAYREKKTLQMSNVIFSCYLLKFQNVCIDGIIPNTVLLDNPSNIIWPNNLLAKMQNGCWFVIIETILETWSHFSWHDKHWCIVLLEHMTLNKSTYCFCWLRALPLTLS